MPTYNGHPSYNAWNIARWISNDEPLYRFALDCIKRMPNLKAVTERFIGHYGLLRTPDGVPYTATNVRLALAGLKDRSCQTA